MISCKLKRDLFAIGNMLFFLQVMSKFSWGDSFFKINAELLAAYTECEDSTAVVAAQKKFLDEVKTAREAKGSRGVRSYNDTDLLQRNPNHAYDEGDEEDGGTESEQDTESGEEEQHQDSIDAGREDAEKYMEEEEERYEEEEGDLQKSANSDGTGVEENIATLKVS